MSLAYHHTFNHVTPLQFSLEGLTLAQVNSLVLLKCKKLLLQCSMDFLQIQHLKLLEKLLLICFIRAKSLETKIILSTCNVAIKCMHKDLKIGYTLRNELGQQATMLIFLLTFDEQSSILTCLQKQFVVGRMDCYIKKFGYLTLEKHLPTLSNFKCFFIPSWKLARS